MFKKDDKDATNRRQQSSNNQIALSLFVYLSCCVLCTFYIHAVNLNGTRAEKASSFKIESSLFCSFIAYTCMEYITWAAVCLKFAFQLIGCVRFLHVQSAFCCVCTANKISTHNPCTYCQYALVLLRRMNWRVWLCECVVWLCEWPLCMCLFYLSLSFRFILCVRILWCGCCCCHCYLFAYVLLFVRTTSKCSVLLDLKMSKHNTNG